MIEPSLLGEPGRVDEPEAAQDFAAVITRVVSAGRPVIVRRDGQDLAAVVPLEYLDRLRALEREHLEYREVEDLAAAIDWTGSRDLRPPQSWLDDDGDNPFEPAEGSEP